MYVATLVGAIFTHCEITFTCNNIIISSSKKYISQTKQREINGIRACNNVTVQLGKQEQCFYVYICLPLVNHTRGLVIGPCAHLLNNCLGRSLCLLIIWERKALNLASMTSPNFG